MSLRSTARPEPSTPKKDHLQGTTRVDAIIKELNTDYNLEIDSCDKSLTPSQRRNRATFDRRFARYDKIYQVFQQIYFQAGEDGLGTALDAFRREAKAACQTWISKPIGDPGTLHPSAPCKASTRGEKNELEEILVDILDQLRKTLQPTPIKLRKPAAAPDGRDEGTNSFAVPSRPSQPKRPSIDGLQGSSKRLKERQLELSHSATTGDKFPARETVAFDDLPDVNPGPSIFRDANKSFNHPLYVESANTSKTSLMTSMFSSFGTKPVPSSQTTVNGTQEPEKTSGRVAPAANAFAPSSRDGRAHDQLPLSEQGHAVDADNETNQWVTNQCSRRRARQRSPELASSPGHGTDYSGFSELLDFQMPDNLEPPSTALEARLKNIWRR